MKYFCLIALLSLTPLAVPQAGTTQEIAWSYRAAPGGWVGITVDFTLRSIGGQEETLVVITEVAKGGPAEEAGIRVGDTITHLNGRQVSQRVFSSFRDNLKPGDPVRIMVNRRGMPLEFLVEANEAPPSTMVVGPDARRMVIELETLSGNILKNLDSLRLNFAGTHLDSTTGDVRLQILRVPTIKGNEEEVGVRFRIFEPFPETLVVAPGDFFMAPEFTMPFQALIVESPATSALKAELAKLGRETTAVRREELSRRRELSATRQGSVEEMVTRDDRIREIRAREASLLAEQQELSARLRRVSEEEMQRHWMELQREQESGLARAREDYDAVMGRLGSPVIMGQNIMMGAQLAPLSPDLAQYFPVDEGVFVVQVMQGTPASDAGLQGGDVIVRVGGEEVTSLSDLRFGLGNVEGPLRIRVIRKGNPVEILIRR